MKTKLIAAGVLAASAMATAQTTVNQEVRKEVRVIVNGSPVVTTAGSSLGDTFTFVSNEFSFDGKPVASAPYSAESVTESIQALTDGNRITHKTTSQVYRDGQGRTRREESLPLPGAAAKKMIFINDPVAKVSYILDPEKKTARKISLSGNGGAFVMNRSSSSGSSASSSRTSSNSAGQTITVRSTNGDVIFEKRVKGPNGEETVVRKVGEEAKAEAERLHTGAAGHLAEEAKAEAERLHTGAAGHLPAGAHGETMVHAMPAMSFAGGSLGEAKNAKVDQLGKKVIEGVECTGSRTTVTLAAGTIGNERPIDTVTETWTSTELQTAVQTRRSDPRTGETSFKLTNVRRGEPLRTLFEVPADYKMEEGGGGSGNVMFFNHKTDGTAH